MKTRKESCARRMRRAFGPALVLCASTLPPSAYAQDVQVDPKHVQLGKAEYSPYLDRGYPDRVYFGDTHLHTSYSTDAGMMGCRLGPEEAYRFARGEEVTSSTGVRARLLRPLDFLVVADHAENLGLAPMIAESNPDLLKSEWGRKVHDLVKSGKGGDAYNAWGEKLVANQDPLKGNDALTRSMWARETAAAEKYNDPGKFTAFIGFEWSSAPDGNNLHRNVIFRDGKAEADLVIPFSQYDSQDPEDLWKWMSETERKTGGRVLAIPHNGNLSSGLMFDDVTLEETARPRLRGAPDALGADLRSHPDERRRRGAPGALPERRVCGFRNLGQGKLRPRRPYPRHAPARVRARSLQARPGLRGEAGGQPVQVRPRRLERLAHGAGDHHGGQLLRKGHAARAFREKGPLRRGHHGPNDGGCRGPTIRVDDERLRPRRGVGDRQHSRSAVGRDGAQGGVRDFRDAPHGTHLRRVRLHARRRAAP